MTAMFEHRFHLFCFG